MKKENIPNPNSVVFIAAGTKIEGNIISENEVKFNGELQGNITCSSKLVVGTEGVIRGDIFAKNAIISGKVEGKIFIDELLILTSTACIKAEIRTNKIAIENGVSINATISTNSGEEK